MRQAHEAALAAVGRVGRSGRIGARHRCAGRVVQEVVVELLDRVGGLRELLGAHHAHADIAAHAFGAEVGLEVARVDLLVDVVDEVFLGAVVRTTVGLVQVIDVGRVVDAREHVGIEAARDVADRIGQEEARLRVARSRIAATLVAAVVIVGRVAARAHPVGVAGIAVDLAVTVLGAELDRVQPAGLEQLGDVSLEVVLLDLGALPRRIGRAGVDFGDAVHQLLLQVGREGGRRRTGQVPGAVQVARQVIVADLATRLGRHPEVHRRTTFGPGAATGERGLPQRADVPVDGQVSGLRECLFLAVATGQLRRRNRAVVRAPAAGLEASGLGLVFAAVVGLSGQLFELGAGNGVAAGIEIQAVEQAAAGPVSIAVEAGHAPFRNLQHVLGVVTLQLEAEVVGRHRNVVDRLELEGQLAALAFALLFLHREVDRRRHEEVAVVAAGLVVEAGLAPPVVDTILRLHVAIGIARLAGAIPLVVLGAGFHGAGGALLLRHADQHAETLVLAVPRIQGRRLRVDIVVGIGGGALERDEARVGFHVQRATGVQDDRAADAAFVDAGFRRFEQLGAGQHVRRQQGVVERTGGFVVGFRRGHVVAVQLGQGQVRRKAAHADALAFTTAAGDDHAGHALQCVGHVLVGELADVFGGDHFDHGVGVALLLKTLFNGVAVAGDLDAVQVGGFLRAGGSGLLRGGASRNDGGGQGQRDGQRQCILAMRTC